jgi:hypothetical protein
MSRRPSGYEISYALLCQRLRGALANAVLAGPGAAGIGSGPWQVSAALYMLLMGHPVDRRGRCRSCRRSGAVLGFRRRRCRVHGEARFWLLQQPAEFLLSRLVCELGLTDLPPAQDSATHTAARDLGDTDVLPRAEPDPSDPRTEPFQTPAVPPPLPPRQAGQMPTGCGRRRHRTSGSRSAPLSLSSAVTGHWTRHGLVEMPPGALGPMPRRTRR